MTSKTTKVIGVRVPVELAARLAVLANKQGITLSEWCKLTLMSKARSDASEKVS